MEINFIILILIAHYFSDFLMQNEEIANNKHKSLDYLIVHSATYGLWMILVMLLCVSVLDMDVDKLLVIDWMIINTGLHFVIDFVSSKITASYYKKGKFRSFLNIIWLDQIIHIILLITTFNNILIK